MSRVDMKIVLLGHSSVGKTSLVQRFINDNFNERYQNTIGTAFAAKEVIIDGKKLYLGIWDTAGSERFYSMVKVYYRGARAAIICYDVTNEVTFKKALHWIRELRSTEENCLVYLCATKSDCLKNVSDASPNLDYVKKYADGIQSKFFITSSKTGENIVELFEEIVRDYFANPGNAPSMHNMITLSQSSSSGTNCFCK